MNEPKDQNGHADPVDAAIAATEQPKVEEHIAINVTISSSGRHANVSIPPDLSETEILDLMGWFATAVRQAAFNARQAKDPASRIEVARVMPRGGLPPSH